MILFRRSSFSLRHVSAPPSTTTTIPPRHGAAAPQETGTGNSRNSQDTPGMYTSITKNVRFLADKITEPFTKQPTNHNHPTRPTLSLSIQKLFGELKKNSRFRYNSKIICFISYK
jgi:hypothetical protein